ncbi:hypothetical protein [Occultella gossypii]|uniref:Uncharacterized protein n=1 Tax=Occultella gossypii TaxID=2800820 RepID=A0ABS7S2Q0_9MICO|nr:hypothetical protein [Occultella gossypii]MBZ2194611.1 hypothetical protein [Occultella gossypii]
MARRTLTGSDAPRCRARRTLAGTGPPQDETSNQEVMAMEETHREDPRRNGDEEPPADDPRPEAPGSEQGDTHVDTSVTPVHGTGSEPELPHEH